MPNVLKPIFQQEKISYIPVEHHQVALRELFTEEEARQLLESEEAMKDELLKQAVRYVLHMEQEEEE